jgi:putative heme iron utilization protein
MTDHVRSGPSAEGESPREPSFAEKSRTLVHLGRIGALATQSRHAAGFPFASVAPYGVDTDGSPTFLISTMAMHTQNVLADDRASLLVTQPDWHGDPLAGARVTLLGPVSRVDGDALEALRTDYLERHQGARDWVDFRDFHFYRMDVTSLYWVGGFGSMGWVEPDQYRSAAVDPLAEAAAGILAHMNEEHADALLLYCRVLAGVEADEATMIAVDRLGFRVRACTAEGVRGLRLSFAQPVQTPEEARKALVAMVREARQRAGV